MQTGQLDLIKQLKELGQRNEMLEDRILEILKINEMLEGG